MSFWSRFRLPSRPRAVARRQRSRAPRLEQLEDRCLMSVASTSPIARSIAATVAAGATLPAKNDNVVIDWNATALEAIWAGGTQPTVASRALAMVQVAVYDAVDAIDPVYALYPVPGFHAHAPAGASADAAAAAAADEVLTSLFPQQKPLFDAQFQASLAAVPDGAAKAAGVAFGRTVADAVLAWRSTDGSNAASNYQPAAPGTNPGEYELTPPNFTPAVSPQWGGVTPFAMKSASQFLPPGPPPLTSLDYAADYDITKALGGTDSTLRTPTETQIAHFWADLPSHSVTPSGHWNEIAEKVSLDAGLNVVETARVFALLDIGEADAAISCWNAKYLYNFWRPVTAIQYAGLDGNPLTVPQAGWAPLWNTPAFPEYTSGHSTFSGAAATILTSLFGDNVRFTIGTDDMPGYTRTFQSFNQAADEAGFSRILGGIHFMSANLDGLQAGRELGQYVMSDFLTPLHDRHDLAAAPGLTSPGRSAEVRRSRDWWVAGRAAWEKAWELASEIVSQSGAGMTPAQRAELTALIAWKLEIVIRELGSLDFS